MISKIQSNNAGLFLRPKGLPSNTATVISPMSTAFTTQNAEDSWLTETYPVLKSKNYTMKSKNKGKTQIKTWIFKTGRHKTKETKKHCDGSLTTHGWDGYKQRMGSQRIKHSLKKGAQKNWKTKRNPKKTMTTTMQNEGKQKQKWIFKNKSTFIFVYRSLSLKCTSLISCLRYPMFSVQQVFYSWWHTGIQIEETVVWVLNVDAPAFGQKGKE